MGAAGPEPEPAATDQPTRGVGSVDPAPIAVEIPAALHRGAGSTAAGAAWIERLPGLVASAVRRWDLELAAPFTRGMSSWAAPGRVRSGPWVGREVVLKVSFPHDEAISEADGLRLWHGHGSAELLDAASWDLLLVRCAPGTSLAEDPRPAGERLVDAARSLGALHDAGRSAAQPARSPGSGIGAPAFPDLAAVCAAWADTMAERAQAARSADPPTGLDFGLIRQGADLLRVLPRGVEPVVVHGDANPGNLLRDGEAWVWIDPKPMIGDAGYDPWPMLEQIGDPHAAPDPPAALRGPTATVADILGLDPARVAAWALARCAESALWAWAEGDDVVGARDYLRRARTWAVLAG